MVMLSINNPLCPEPTIPVTTAQVLLEMLKSEDSAKCAAGPAVDQSAPEKLLSAITVYGARADLTASRTVSSFLNFSTTCRDTGGEPELAHVYMPALDCTTLFSAK